MINAGFENVINNIFFWITWIFELVGAGIIIFGAVVCGVKYIQSLSKHKQLPVKTMLANQIALGLEFMLAGEILRTVMTTHRNLNEIAMLAAIVILRASLSLLIHWELKNEEKRDEVTDKKTRRLVNKSNDA